MPKIDSLPSSVVVHPLVLLSAVDHYTRLGTSGNQRVVGVLLGTSREGVVDVLNSYAGACFCVAIATIAHRLPTALAILTCC